MLLGVSGVVVGVGVVSTIRSEPVGWFGHSRTVPRQSGGGGNGGPGPSEMEAEAEGRRRAYSRQ
jgi:hypothetical protein